MPIENYADHYPIDAVSIDKFSELIGKPKTAVLEMARTNKLPVIELKDPLKVNARVGEKWIYIPEFNRAVKEAYYNRAPEQRDAWLLWIGL